MTFFESLAVVVTASALFAYANQRWLRLPPAVGLMALALLVSLALIGIDRIGWLPLGATAGRVLAGIDFNEALMHGMLGAPLFAGALHVDLETLKKEALAVSSLAAGGTVLSTFGSSKCRSPVSRCSTTASRSSSRSPCSAPSPAGARRPRGASPGSSRARPGGGALVGLATGWVTFLLLRSIDHYHTELLLTVALVFGGYALAEAVHVPAPIAAVVSGLVIGSRGRSLTMSRQTREHLDTFWELIDELLNAVLFVLMGFELIRLSFHSRALLLCTVAVPIVLLARAASVGLFVVLLRRVASFGRGSWSVLTWGGLRGGISVALALGLPRSPERDVIVLMTYVVVVFSIVVQGLTLEAVARRLGASSLGVDARPGGGRGS